MFWDGVQLRDRLAQKEVLRALPTKTSVLDTGYNTTWDRYTNNACLATQTREKKK